MKLKGLKDYAEERGLMMTQVAKIIRKTDAQCSKWTNGVRLPSIKTLVEISQRLEVSLDYLVYGKESHND